MNNLEVDLRIYRDATDLAYRRGYEDGRLAQALTDDEFIEAVARFCLDAQRLDRDIAQVVRETIAALEAQRFRMKLRAA
ncbi:hypothetical protein [Brevibacterium yomogidense]|uniref:hypothetical protein n=1 Tax=Brevibacterium yomogidense TaxID=946573 RepID=UPI0018E013FF|nr:hypothetical protein [Brevibacterium yomogidense]